MPLSDLLDILQQYRGASPANPPATVEQDYSQVAQSAPQSHLASGLAEAFRSNECNGPQKLDTKKAFS